MKKFYDILKSQKLGVIIGFTVTGLLIIGSLIMNFLPQQYAGLSGEDISFFFNEKRPVHIWFYLLFFACIVYGVNTTLCTLDSILRKVKVGVKKIPVYGASVVHIGFVITLVAHLVGGLYSSSTAPVTVMDKWTDMGGFEMKVTDLKTSAYPNGMPRKIRGYVDVRKDGKVYSDTIGYNNPVLLENGSLEVLLRNYGFVPSTVILKIDGVSRNIKVGELFTINSIRTRVADLYMPPQYRYPVLKLITADENNQVKNTFVAIGENNAEEIYGTKVAFADIQSVPGVVVNTKNNPSIPLTFITIFFFSIGMVLVIIRTIGRMSNY